MKNLLVGVCVGLVAFASGCGKLSDSQQQDVANIVGGLGNNFNKPTLTGAGLTAQGSESSPSFMGLIQQHMTGAIWLYRFKLQAGDTSGVSAGSAQDLTFSSCPTGSITSGGASCTLSCPTTSKLQVACTTSATTSNSCNGTTYTFSNESFAITTDISAITGTSTANYTGTFGLSLTFSANVNGGNLSGDALSCTLGFSFDIAKAEAGTAQAPALDCGNFSCTYGGKALDCNKVQSDFGSSAKCS